MIGKFFIVLLISISIISPNTFAVDQGNTPKAKTSTSPPQELASKIDALSSTVASIQTDIDLIKKQNRVFSKSIVKVNDENILKGINKCIDALNYLIYVLSLSFVFLLIILGLIFQRLYNQSKKSNKSFEDSSILQEIRSIKELQKDILPRVSKIEKKQERLSKGETKTDLQFIETTSPITNFPSHFIQEKEDEISSFLRLYNAAIENSNVREEFQRKYKITRFGITNAMERRRDSNISPVFKTASDGDYYLTEISKRFIVVPRFDMTLQESSYSPGAMGLVFSCPDYNPQLRYRRVKVIKPAIFESSGEQWVLKEKGELNLGQGE